MMMIGQVQVSNMSSKKAEQAAVEEKFEEEDEGAWEKGGAQKKYGQVKLLKQ